MFKFFKKNKTEKKTVNQIPEMKIVNQIQGDEKRSEEISREIFSSLSNSNIKRTAYKSISNEIDSAIFNVLSMNEDKMVEIYNCIDWNNVIVTMDVLKSSIVYLKLLTAIVDYSDVVAIEKVLNAYVNKEISDMEAHNFLLNLIKALGGDLSFLSNSLMYVNTFMKE